MNFHCHNPFKKIQHFMLQMQQQMADKLIRILNTSYNDKKMTPNEFLISNCLLKHWIYLCLFMTLII